MDSQPSALKSPFNPSSQIPQTTYSSLIVLSQEGPKLSSSFSSPSTLFKKECSSNSFATNGFRTLLQNTGGIPSPATQGLPALSTGAPLRTHSNACNSITVMHLLNGSLDTPGVGSLATPPSFTPSAEGPFAASPHIEILILVFARERRIQATPRRETPCQPLPSCIDSSGTAHLPNQRRSLTK